MALPKLPRRDGIVKRESVAFGGLDRRRAARDGAICDMKNLTGDEYPLLAVRRPRRLIRTLAAPNGMTACDGLWYADGDGLFRDGVRVCGLTNGRKRMCVCGEKLVVFPDRVAVDIAAGAAEAMDFTRTETGTLVFCDGTFAGEPARANTLRFSAAVTGLRVGDAVTVRGAAEPKNNGSRIVREISADGRDLRFYEDAFTLPEGSASYVDPGAVTVERLVPDLDFCFSHQNRLWGAKGDVIYASKPGDPFNFEVFDGLDSDAWQIDVGGAEDFTGGAEFMGLACFFKPSRIYKVYGSRPAAYEAMAGATLGAAEGCGDSLAVAGETLFYVSRTGVAAYSGGLPRDVGAPLGDLRVTAAAAGSDGVRYYLSARDVGGQWSLFCYDTRTGLWHREDDLHVLDFAWDGALYALCADGRILALSGGSGGTEETGIESYAEFGDFVEGSPNRKGVSKLQLRGEATGTLTVKISFDGGPFETVRTLCASSLRSWYLPIVPRRADRFRIRLEGVGAWRLHSLVREVYGGSEQ